MMESPHTFAACVRCRALLSPRGGRVVRFCPRCGQIVSARADPFGRVVPQPPSENYRLTVVAFICSLAGLLIPVCGAIPALAGVGLALAAQREIDASNGRYGGRGLATAATVIGIIGLLLWGCTGLAFVFRR